MYKTPSADQEHMGISAMSWSIVSALVFLFMQTQHFNKPRGYLESLNLNKHVPISIYIYNQTTSRLVAMMHTDRQGIDAQCTGLGSLLSGWGLWGLDSLLYGLGWWGLGKTDSPVSLEGFQTAKKCRPVRGTPLVHESVHQASS